MSDQPPEPPVWPPSRNEPPPSARKLVLGSLLTIVGCLAVGGGILVFLVVGCVSMLSPGPEPLLNQSVFAIVLGVVVVLVGTFVLIRR